MGACLARIFECLRRPHKKRLQLVTFDRKYKGDKVSVTSFVIVGDGTALANAALHQSRAHWECKVIEPGTFCVGVSHRLNPGHLNGHLDCNTRHKWGLKFGTDGLTAKAGDVIGVSLDQSEIPVLHFSLNGARLEGRSIRGIRGLVFPAMSVSNGARLDANFGPGKFKYELPRGFSGVIRAQDII